MSEVPGYKPPESKQPSTGKEAANVVKSAGKEATKQTLKRATEYIFFGGEKRLRRSPGKEKYVARERQQPPKVNLRARETLRRSATDIRTTQARLAQVRGELAPYKDGVLVPQTPEQQRSNQRFLAEHQSYEHSKRKLASSIDRYGSWVTRNTNNRKPEARAGRMMQPATARRAA